MGLVQGSGDVGMEGGHGRDLGESRAGKGSHGSPDKKAMSIKAVAEAQRPGEGDNCGAGEEGRGLHEGWGRCSVRSPASLWLSSPVRAALAAEGRGVEATWWQPLRGLSEKTWGFSAEQGPWCSSGGAWRVPSECRRGC